ncbi:MAG: DUF6597 domain-containing transcriptional factor [Saprospiraceae bacterium]
MIKIEFIRNLFKPIQPSVKEGNKDVVYNGIAPNKKLKNIIHCYWQIKTNKFLDAPYVYRVVSDGCVDIFFNLNNTNESFVMGFCRSYTEFPLGKDFNYFGVRFYPSVFPLIFGISAKSLLDKDQPLKSILPNLDKFISKEIHGNLSKSIQELNDFFISLIDGKQISIDGRFYHALMLILEQNGYLQTEKDLNIGLGSRQLRRLFNYYIGTTPKSFS